MQKAKTQQNGPNSTVIPFPNTRITSASKPGKMAQRAEICPCDRVRLPDGRIGSVIDEVFNAVGNSIVRTHVTVSCAGIRRAYRPEDLVKVVGQ